MSYRFSTRSEARQYLGERYDDLVQQYWRLARIPRSLYIRRNLAAAMRVTADES